MQVKGKLESEGSRTCLTANIDGRVLKSWLVDQEGTIHLFTKVHCAIKRSYTVIICKGELVIMKIVEKKGKFWERNE